VRQCRRSDELVGAKCAVANQTRLQRVPAARAGILTPYAWQCDFMEDYGALEMMRRMFGSKVETCSIIRSIW
jgi:hypothetical protein